MAKQLLTAAAAVGRSRQAGLDLYAGLRPVIIGPRAALHRYAVASERVVLGAYNPSADTDYDYPGKEAGSTIDLTSVKLYASTADLNYFSKYVGSDGSCQPSSSYPNRVRAANFIFKTGNGGVRSAVFKDRDVKVGDVAWVRGVDGPDAVVVSSVVTGFVGDPVAATTGAATSDGANAATQSLSASITQVSGTPYNDVAAAVNGAAYESSADGYINRTYTITVTQSSTGNSAPTARLRVRSADGLDDQDDVAPEDFGSPTPIGTKGLTVTFSIDPLRSSSSVHGIDEDDLVVGQQWTAQVSQAFTQPVPTSAGTYTGPQDTTYVVLVSRGGPYAGADKPQITVTTSTGVDQAVAVDVTAAATAIAVGSYGVTIAFTGSRLRKGDKYYVVVTAVAEGDIHTLVLQDDIPADIRGTEVDLRLFARRADVEIPKIRTEPSTAANWSAAAAEVTVEGGIYLTDSEFTDGGEMFGVPLDAATLYLEYREWVTTGVGTVVSLNDPDEIDAALGTVDPDNPIAYAVSKALGMTSGELLGDPARPAADTTDVVLAVALGGDPANVDLWTAALEAVEADESAYQLVPLTTDATVLAAVVSHVATESVDAAGYYRVAWLTPVLAETAAVVDAAHSTDGNTVTATVSGTTVTAGVNAGFVTAGVRAGDKVRTNYGLDAFGDETYDEYTVSVVVSETTLTLAAGPTVPISVAVRVEVWRTYTKEELVVQLTDLADSYRSDRIRLVWPDQIGFGGVSLAGYHLAAGLAGLAGSVPSHQGLRNVQLVGFDDAPRATGFFTAAQLLRLGSGGLFVVAETPDGRIYTNTASTTDTTSTATAEEMVVRNVDMIRKAVQDAWAPYIGAGNVVSNIRQLLDGALASLAGRLRSGGYAQEIGPPVGDIAISAINAVPGQPSAIEVVLAVTGLAVPLNQIRVVLPVSL